MGNRSGMTGTGGPQGYQYDQLYRLTQATYPGSITDNYTYDQVGNRLTKNGATSTYDAADELLSAPGGLTYGYDPNGNQTSRGTSTLAYDHQNRLTKITPPNTPVPDNPCYDLTGDGYVDIADQSQVSARFGTHTGDPNYDAFYDLNSDGFIDITDLSLIGGQFGKACPSTFTYNGDGLRVASGGSWLNSKYVWDTAAGLPVILKETDSHQAASSLGTDNTYVYGLGLISVTDRTGAQTYYTSDGLGSTTDLPALRLACHAGRRVDCRAEQIRLFVNHLACVQSHTDKHLVLGLSRAVFLSQPALDRHRAGHCPSR